METNQISAKISEQDFDLQTFVQLAIDDEHVRREIVHQMVTNTAIMVYYHCYYVVDKASQLRPELFYPYWGDFAQLLQHRNSYHRDFALEITGNLTQVDHENRFAEIADDYYRVINDEKFMTGNCCVKNLLKIYRYKVEQRERIIEILLDIDNRCDYSSKHKALLKADVLVIFDEIYLAVRQKAAVAEFIRAELDSISPKTRKKAKELIQKHNL